MSAQKRIVLKNWFRKGLIPSQEQFADAIDSFFHKAEDMIPIGQVDGLVTEFNNKKYELQEYVSSLLDKALAQLETSVQDKQDKMLTATVIPAAGLADNTEYTLGEVSELDLTTIPDVNKDGIVIYFSASTGGCTLTYNEGTEWFGTDGPSIEAGKNYMVVIVNRICAIHEHSPRTKE